MNKEKYSQNPILCNEIVYEDNNLKLIKKWTWNVKSIYENEDAQVCEVLLDGEYSNGGGKSTLVSYKGERLTNLEFDYLGDYEDDMWRVRINNQGYGFLNKEHKIAVPLKYQYADDFCNGYAAVHNGKEWLYMDKKGNEIYLHNNKYKRLGSFSDGLARVSTLSWMDLAYHSDYGEDAGNWGYVNEKGEEVIKPQYIYAFDFYNDRAIVVKGKWTRDKKWDNECNQGKYWTEDELWGVIDKTGKEIIPCIYDEIKEFINNDYSVCEEYYQVHVGGWKDGKWAIIDRNGNFVTDPIFEEYSYDYCNGMMTYYKEATYDKDSPQGVYDLKTNKILFEPKFEDVDFRDDGNIKVEIFDEKLGYKIKKIIDVNGNEIFKSNYTSIYDWGKPYLAMIEKEALTICNKIDKNGQVLDSFETKDKLSYWDSAINFETRTYIYSQNKKFGLKNFDGHILIPAKYEYFKMCYHNSDLYYFKLKEDNDDAGLMKLDGTIIIPPKYRNISLLSNKKIICNGKNHVDVFEYETI